MQQNTNNCEEDAPICLLMMGMAGSGKTTFVHQLTGRLAQRGEPAYTVNLDPAVRHVPYPVNVDIRDSINYRDLMRKQGLGPNGAIVTALNLFSANIAELVQLIGKQRANNNESQSFQQEEDKTNKEIPGPRRRKYAVIDTPGQIEVFRWSAAGQIILQALASSFRTVVVFVLDTSRCHNATTFMSNMLYACGVFYQHALPFLLLMNKTDITDCAFVDNWMENFDEFLEDLSEDSMSVRRSAGGAVASREGTTGGGGGYMTALNRSLCLVLEEFYSKIDRCGVSSLSGSGMQHLLDSKLPEMIAQSRIQKTPHSDNNKTETSDDAARQEFGGESEERDSQEAREEKFDASTSILISNLPSRNIAVTQQIGAQLTVHKNEIENAREEIALRESQRVKDQLEKEAEIEDEAFRKSLRSQLNTMSNPKDS